MAPMVRKYGKNVRKSLGTTAIVLLALAVYLIFSAGAILYTMGQFLPDSANTAIIANISSGGLASDAEPVVKQKAAETKVETNGDGHLLKHPKDGRVYRLIFSTDCSEFQHWQSYLLFHAAMKVGQTGTITRIVSGCDDKQKKEVQDWHATHVTKAMSNRFLIHFTPHFSYVKEDADGNRIGDYRFFNKPFGLRHWLEHSTTIGFSEKNTKSDGVDALMNAEDDVVILIDPDTVLLRPITGDFSNERDVVVTGKRARDPNRKYVVEHGAPFAQVYGLGAQWRNFNIDEIAGPNSPAKEVSFSDGLLYYPAGPPYLATVRDMHAISVKWTEFVRKVHKEYPHLLAEMYAFCIAIAHLKLPHTLMESLMVSNTVASGEGWPMIDAITKDETPELCKYAANINHDEHAVPSVIHYCQNYAIGRSFFAKRKMAKDFFECQSPLMVIPPDDIIEFTGWKMPFNEDRTELGEKMARRDGFMTCAMLNALNDASAFFKNKHCPDGANFEMTLNWNNHPNKNPKQ